MSTRFVPGSLSLLLRFTGRTDLVSTLGSYDGNLGRVTSKETSVFLGGLYKNRVSDGWTCPYPKDKDTVEVFTLLGVLVVEWYYRLRPTGQGSGPGSGGLNRNSRRPERLPPVGRVRTQFTGSTHDGQVATVRRVMRKFLPDKHG